ncbi:protein iscX [Candidatus Photodesmus blepharus]|uniref:Protein iscX n=1 Tax=Candidatus Photodesmus blepharonis TaxID=1179155 RepID=A0A084CPG2_9GAMM|nr:Fe-S cluster assembly protein IscX [Candidatus Photodesmus blepharus]KEY91691.1 protein iscX [Candidatus Photodesmus blepharus]
MNWKDSRDIAIELHNLFPDVDPKTVRLTDLYQWVLDLNDFDGKPDHSSEKILEAILLCWMKLEKSNS